MSRTAWLTTVWRLGLTRWHQDEKGFCYTVFAHACKLLFLQAVREKSGFFTDISSQKSLICPLILNVKNPHYNSLHMTLSHTLCPQLGVFKEVSERIPTSSAE